MKKKNWETFYDQEALLLSVGLEKAVGLFEAVKPAAVGVAKVVVGVGLIQVLQVEIGMQDETLNVGDVNDVEEEVGMSGVRRD